jgi:elongation factor P
MKVNANQLRTGHVIEFEGKLYAVLKAQNIQPGKGNAVTQVELRRIADGIKVMQRFRTVESVERVYIDERTFQYLFGDGDSFTFMDQENFDQITLPKDILGDMAQYLQDGMLVQMSMFEGTPVAVEIPATVILEVVETEPTVKGQTAASSYKPAILSNGMRTTVPAHVAPGARIVVATVDGSYMERAKA